MQDVWIDDGRTLTDHPLGMAADSLDDIERVSIASENRLRQLTRSVEDKDGELRGFGLDASHPSVIQQQTIVDGLLSLRHQAELYLKRAVRKHPLARWIKDSRGVGEQQAARLLAAIGDPYIRPEMVKPDGTIIPRGPRTVSALWKYCGLHVEFPGLGPDGAHLTSAGEGGDSGQSTSEAQWIGAGVAPKRRKGQVANWNPVAKMRAYLIATSCLKQLVKPCTSPDEDSGGHVDNCKCSVYRLKYDQRRACTRKTHPDWTPLHSHNDALRVASKEILKDLWCAGRQYHLAN